MCVYCKSDAYVPPTDYNPNITDHNYNLEITKDVHNTCMSILEKASYYVTADNKLKGYRWINFPMRILLTIRNWLANGEPEKKVVQKITDAFNFILNINTDKPLYIDNDQEIGLHNTYFNQSIKFYATYETLAKKVIKQYRNYPELTKLAHRILHERQDWVDIPVEVTLPNGQMRQQTKQVRNIAENVGNTPYARTTVWNKN